MLGRLSITQKLATAVVAPLVALVGLSGVGFTTFNRVKVNGPEYQKLATTADLVADVLPPPLFFIESHFIAQSMLQANASEFPALVKKSNELEKSFEERHQYWVENIGVIGEPQLNDPFLKESWNSGEAYFKVFNDEFVPSLKSAYSRGWDPDEVQVVINEPAVKAQTIFDSKLDPLYRKHRAAIDKTVQIANARRTSLESDVSATVGRRLLGLALIAFSGAVATFLLSSFVARAIRRPIKQLTDAANRAASEDLPLMVAAAQAGEESPVSSAQLVNIESNDEIAELAAAFASMQGTAVGLAREQALIRRNVGENLVNLARRNQSLLGRSLGVLTRLEQDERDQDKLQDLFKVDHLTTRMRRNAESLLVLAGAEPNRKWSAGVEMGDVVRAAVSAIEAFDRVDIVGLDDVKVRGAAVNDVAHLVAELIENATNFSPPDSRVAVVGKARPDGYLLVVTDDGLGMSEEDLAIANARIAETSAFESSPTKVLGLNVVGRLAYRYGIDVSLATSSTAGIAARIQLPIALIETSDESAATPSQTAEMHGESALADPGFNEAAGPENPTFTEHGSDSAFETNDIPEWLQNVAGVSMESDSNAASDWATTTFGQPAIAALAVDVAQEVPVPSAIIAPAVPNNVRLLRPAPPEKPALTRRIKGAQTVETGPLPEEAQARQVLADPERASSVLSSLSSLQSGVEKGRSIHPSEIPLAEEELTPVTETTAASTGDTMKLSKRVRGAQMVDTGPEAVTHGPLETSDDPERADTVKRALTGLQRGMERGRSAEPGELLEASFAETVELSPAALALEESPATEASPSLRKRVKGAQLPVTDLPAVAAQVQSDPTAVRNAFGSLQRGVTSAREAIAGSSDDSYTGPSVAEDPSTLGAPAPTH